MRTYVFVFENSPTMDKDGFDTKTSFSIKAPDFDAAIIKLAEHCSEQLDWSDDPDTYRNDVDDGNLTVVVPTEIV